MTHYQKSKKKAQRAGLLHGILFIVLFSLSAFYIADLSIIKSIHLSPLIVGILIGMGYANSLRNRLPATWVPGILFSSKKLLRLGIILYGFRLTIQNILSVGMSGFITDILIVTSVMLLGLLLGKMLKMDKELTIFTSIGSAVCGAAAVLGAESVIRGRPYKAAVAVATVVIFGTIAMFLYPIMYNSGWLNMPEKIIGIYTGSTVHEVAHVVGAGDAMNNATIASDAVIVKMIRVMLLAPLLLILGFFINKNNHESDDVNKQGKKIAVPWFAFIFLGVIILNSGLVWLTDNYALDFIPTIVNGINHFDTFILTMAMTALGCETNVKSFKQAGAKPFLMAAILFAYLLVGGFYITKYVSIWLG